jgi:hypothetical protein
MPKQEFVVKYNEQTDLYLTSYSDPEHCTWGSPSVALTWGTLAQAQSVAAAIGGGTVGTTKPNP